MEMKRMPRFLEGSSGDRIASIGAGDPGTVSPLEARSRQFRPLNPIMAIYLGAIRSWETDSCYSQ